jgi:hypothetical protein
MCSEGLPLVYRPLEVGFCQFIGDTTDGGLPLALKLGQRTPDEIPSIVQEFVKGYDAFIFGDESVCSFLVNSWRHRIRIQDSVIRKGIAGGAIVGWAAAVPKDIFLGALSHHHAIIHVAPDGDPKPPG